MGYKKTKTDPRYHHETSPVDYLHQDHYSLHYKFSEMLCLNMQMRHLIKYALFAYIV